MSSRALRRLQKQQEAEKALQSAKEPDVSEDDDDVAQRPVKSKQCAFAFLDDAGNDDHDDEEEADDEPQAAAEPVSVASQVAKVKEDGSSTPKTSKKKKKKKSKASKTNDASATAINNEEDDIDAVLAALAKQKDGSAANTTATTTSWSDVFSILSVESQHLHAINEMRRLFGREAIEDRPRQPQPNPRLRGHRAQQQEGRGFPAVSLKRNIFVQGKEEWPRATTGGLGMEIVNKDPQTGVVEYRFVHSTAYQETQRQYEIAVASMDPQRLVVLLQHNPYHVATLLQVAEIMKHDRMHTEAGDMLERALFAFGRTVHSTFAASMNAGKARLDFRRPENREFYLACWRYIQDLSMRSTWRTVYEWAKLLYSLAPDLDPYGIRLVLDQYAVRANQAEHYINFEEQDVEDPDTFALHTTDPLRSIFSRALCLLRLSQQKPAQQALQYAIEHDKYTAHQLCKVLDIEPLPSALWGHHEAPDAVTELLSTMYTTRAKDLWNTPDAKALLQEVARAVPKDHGKGVGNSVVKDLDVSTARHVYLTENADFIRLLTACRILGGHDPREAGDRPMQDPFPPRDTIRSYEARPLAESMGGVGARGIPPSLQAALGGLPRELLGRLPREQVDAMMEELARMQMGGEGVEMSDGEDEEYDSNAELG